MQAFKLKFHDRDEFVNVFSRAVRPSDYKQIERADGMIIMRARSLDFPNPTA
jgi:hypothetical protein